MSSAKGSVNVQNFFLKRIVGTFCDGDCLIAEFLLHRKPIKDADEDSLSPAVDLDDSEDDSSPLFYQPGKTGFYSPRPGKCSEERLNCFRNVGRYAVNIIYIYWVYSIDVIFLLWRGSTILF